VTATLLIDTHCHLDDRQFDADREAVIERALAAGVRRMVAIGTGEGPPDLETGIRLADRYEPLWATIGVHPHNAAQATAETYKRLAELARHPKVVAFGEIGLDYHYDFAPREAQRAVFAEQLRIAQDAGLPIVIHTREAWDDTFELLHRTATVREGEDLSGIMHCFSGGPDEARRSLDLGFMLSFGGIVTFPKATAVQEAARITPLDRLLVETDAPYLAAVPHRGKRNEPAWVVDTARRLAALRGETFETLAAATTENFARLVRGRAVCASENATGTLETS
jgi:TatD DNase family protein